MTADPSSTTAQRAAALLASRQAELRAQLQAVAGSAADAADKATEVQDFKDVAAQEVQAAMDEATRQHASGELAQIAAALRRLEAGTYGFCEDCGQAIDERRLLALPAAPFCTACQAKREQRGAGRP